MTEVAQAPSADRAQELKRITHWIDGKPWAGTSAAPATLIGYVHVDL